MIGQEPLELTFIEWSKPEVKRKRRTTCRHYGSSCTRVIPSCIKGIANERYKAVDAVLNSPEELAKPSRIV